MVQVQIALLFALWFINASSLNNTEFETQPSDPGHVELTEPTKYEQLITTVINVNPPISELDITPFSSSFHVQWTTENNTSDNLTLIYKEISASTFITIEISYIDREKVIDNLNECTYHLICILSPQMILNENCLILTTLCSSSVNVYTILLSVLTPTCFVLGIIAGGIAGYRYRAHQKPVPPPRPELTLLETYMREYQSSGSPSYITFYENQTRSLSENFTKSKHKVYPRSNSSPVTATRTSWTRRSEETSNEYTDVIESTFDEHFYQYVHQGAIKSAEISKSRSSAKDNGSASRRSSSRGISSDSTSTANTKKSSGLDSIYEEVNEQNAGEHNNVVFRL